MRDTRGTLEEIGFKRNKLGGFLYREPSNRYTIQIIPCDAHWRIGFEKPGGIRWGSERFANAECAAYRAFELVDDQPMLDRLTRCPAGMHQEYQDRIKRTIEKFMKRQGHHDRKRHA